MSTGYELMKSDAKRAIGSRTFLLCVGLFAAIMFASTYGMMQDQTSSIWACLENMFYGSGMVGILLCLLPVLPFGTSYAAEWEDNAVRTIVVRSGATVYPVSKLANAFFSGFLMVFCGTAAFALLVSPFLPLHIQMVASDPYNLFACNGHPAAGLVLWTVHHSCTGGMMAICGVWMSTIMPNRYFGAVMPHVCVFLSSRLAEGLRLPDWMTPAYWVGMIYSAGDIWLTLLVKVLTTVIVCTVMGIFTVLNVRRRLGHE